MIPVCGRRQAPRGHVPPAPSWPGAGWRSWRPACWPGSGSSPGSARSSEPRLSARQGFLQHRVDARVLHLGHVEPHEARGLRWATLKTSPGARIMPSSNAARAMSEASRPSGSRPHEIEAAARGDPGGYAEIGQPDRRVPSGPTAAVSAPPRAADSRCPSGCRRPAGRPPGWRHRSWWRPAGRPSPRSSPAAPRCSRSAPRPRGSWRSCRSGSR